MLTDLRRRLDAVGRLDVLESVGERLDASYNAVGGTTFKKDLKLIGSGGALLLFGGSERGEGGEKEARDHAGQQVGQKYNPAATLFKGSSRIA